MKDLEKVLAITKEQLQRELTPQEEHFLKWIHEKHLNEIKTSNA